MKHIKHFLSRLLSFILPLKVKRIFFIGSVLALLNDKKIMRDETKDRIHELLDLCDDPALLQIPVALQHIVWNGVKQEDIDTYLKNEKPIELMAYILRNTPECLNYKQVQRDLSDLMIKTHGIQFTQRLN